MEIKASGCEPCKPAASSSQAASVKPILRGLHKAQTMRNVGICMVLMCTTGGLYEYFVNLSKRRRYAEFYKNYDACAAFERMKNAGLMDSAK